MQAGFLLSLQGYLAPSLSTLQPCNPSVIPITADESDAFPLTGRMSLKLVFTETWKQGKKREAVFQSAPSLFSALSLGRRAPHKVF